MAAEPQAAEEIADATPVEEEYGTDLVHVAPSQEINLWRTNDPVEVIAQATHLADAYKDVVRQKGLIATIRGREHPQVEAWQLLGSMLGVHPVPVGDPVPLPWPDPLPEGLKPLRDRGLTFGFTASYVAVKNGQTAGGGQSRCTRTESTWRDRDDFALASMAQTRATSKALSGPLRFVMTLAGYQATPADEMPAEAAGDPQHPHGPLVDAAVKQNASQSVLKLVGGDVEAAKVLWVKVQEHCGGYMPQAAAYALLLAGEAAVKVPWDPEYRDDRGDIPTVEEVQQEEAASEAATEAEIAGLEDQALELWGRLVSERTAVKKVKDANRHPEVLRALIKAAGQALAKREAGKSAVGA